VQDLADALHSAQPPVLLERKRPTVVKAKVPIIKCTLAAGVHLRSQLHLLMPSTKRLHRHFNGLLLRLWPVLPALAGWGFLLRTSR
jgi:hypothetical protein